MKGEGFRSLEFGNRREAGQRGWDFWVARNSSASWPSTVLKSWMSPMPPSPRISRSYANFCPLREFLPVCAHGSTTLTKNDDDRNNYDCHRDYIIRLFHSAWQVLSKFTVVVATLLFVEVHRHCLTPFGVARSDAVSIFPGSQNHS